MEQARNIYQPPENHEQHIKAMVKGLSYFFVALVVFVIVFVLNAHRILIHLPFAAEQNFVRPYEELADDWFAKDKSDKQVEIEAYLQALADNMAESMNMPEDIELTLHYLPGDTINAFATLGGHVFVFDGLLAAVPDENSLAMILAHEVAHIKQRDPIVGLGRGLVIQILYSYVVGDYSSGGDMMSFGSELGLLYFGREQEQAADEIALTTLQNHYGHIAGYDNLFTLLREMEQDGDISEKDVEWPSPQNGSQPEWLSTHPELKGRIQHLQEMADSHRWQVGQFKPLPENIAQLINKH